MILTDAGPLIALLDRRDNNHTRCVEAAEHLIGPMLTTWPAFTEAMYLLGGAAGWRAQEPLWALVRSDHLVLADTTPTMLARMPDLMARYSDLPMDLADASLVALAEDAIFRRYSRSMATSASTNFRAGACSRFCRELGNGCDRAGPRLPPSRIRNLPRPARPAAMLPWPAGNWKACAPHVRQVGRLAVPPLQ